MQYRQPLLLCFAFLLVGTALYVQLLCGDYGDKSLLLDCALRYLHGKKLYRDIFELQPPLILLLYALPVKLSGWFGVQDTVVLVLCGVLLIAVSLLLCFHLMRFSPLYAKRRNGTIAWIAILLIALQNPAYFLDREHLFFVLCLPYILRFMPSLAMLPLPVFLRYGIGLMAGIGFCIKPHFAVLFAGIQIIFMISQRSYALLFSKENRMIYGVTVVYGISIWQLTPDYLFTLLPMAMAAYSGHHKPYAWLTYLPFSLLCLGIIFADFRLKYKSPYRSDIVYLLGLLPFVLLYVVANNGWGYTWNLLHNFILLVNLFVWYEFRWLKASYQAQGLPVKPFIFGMRANIACMVINTVFASAILLFAFSNNSFNYTNNANAREFIADIQKFNHNAPIHSFGTMSLEFDTWSRLERYQKIRWETRFSNLWMLRKFDDSDTAFAQRNRWILEYVSKSYAEDLHNNMPEFVFVDKSNSTAKGDKIINFIAYLSVSENFIREWQHYQYIADLKTIEEQKKKQGGDKIAPVFTYALYKRIKE